MDNFELRKQLCLFELRALKSKEDYEKLINEVKNNIKELNKKRKEKVKLWKQAEKDLITLQSQVEQIDKDIIWHENKIDELKSDAKSKGYYIY